MIPRYSHPEMEKIWSDEERFSIWLKIELLAMEAMVREGLVPEADLEEVKRKAGFESARVAEIEKQVKHDVIAFLTNVAEHAGPSARFLHRGMTSSDVLDTCFALQLKRAGELISANLTEAADAVKSRAIEHKHTICIGRTHGMHAEPTTFGIKLIGWYAELWRGKERLAAAIRDISVGKIAGAVGVYASVSPQVESFALERLGLRPETAATQIVARDRHAAFFVTLAGIAASLERFCTEIRHLQRTEVGEAEEPFSEGQKGSSAMPHKKNPILCENICGLARLIRGYAMPALENVALWHERDISHSSAERVIAPDACIALDFMLRRFKQIVTGLVVKPERMLENLNRSKGAVLSGLLLIALADAGLTREESYALVQKIALESTAQGLEFESQVRKNEEIQERVGSQKLKEIFDHQSLVRHADYIFERALAGEG